MNSDWEIVIGLEIHIQINSKSKAFCADRNQFSGIPNSFVSPVTLALPGTLPRVNSYHIESAIKIGLALGSDIQKINYFDRKNYFYPDLPKGYQLTQDEKPICLGGKFTFPMPDGTSKTIRIHHLHMEEDAGKSIHDQHPTKTYLDFNRAGVPLLEVVTEPDFRSADEVFHFINHMQMLVRYLDISDGNMEEGSFRCDCNVSVREKGTTTYGTRCEIKNVNSKKFAKNAIEFEAERQIKLLTQGKSIKRSTLLYDPQTGKTMPMRDKEEVNDYRYFNDPDLPPVYISEELLKRISDEMPATPYQEYKKLTQQYGLSHKEAEVLLENPASIILLEKLISKNAHAREAALLIINKVLPSGIENVDLFLRLDSTADRLLEFLKVLEQEDISKSAAYQILYEKIWGENEETSILDLAGQLNLIQTTDVNEMELWIKNVLQKHPEKILEYNQGKKNLLGFFMGQVMRLSGGKANPETVRSMLENYLDNK